MKRFTDTEKWNDKWYRKLPPKLKCLWIYVCDICDPSGVFEVDWELAVFRIGEAVSVSDLEAFGDRLQTLPHGKFLIKKFIPFQYGKLSIQCRGQRQVFQSITRNGLSECFSAENPSFPIAYAYPIVTHDNTLDTHKTRQDKTGSGLLSSLDQKAKDSVSEIEKFGNTLKEAYRRSLKDPFDYFEQSAMAGIIRERESYKSELQELLAFRKIDPQYFPKSVRGLLEAWSKTLDRARASQDPANNGNGKTPTQLYYSPENTKHLSDAEIEAIHRKKLEDYQKMPTVPLTR